MLSSGCGGQLPPLVQPTEHQLGEHTHARRIQAGAKSALQPLSILWRWQVQDFSIGNDNNIKIIFHFVECILSVQPS